MEIWKPVNGYENYYAVSNAGRVKSLRYNRVLQPTRRNSARYLVVTLSVGGVKTWRYVHRLVAEAFIPNPDNKPQVNHRDGSQQNNAADNLEWCTSAENIAHAGRGGLMARYALTPNQQRHARRALNAGGTLSAVARSFNVSRGTIRRLR